MFSTATWFFILRTLRERFGNAIVRATFGCDPEMRTIHVRVAAPERRRFLFQLNGSLIAELGDEPAPVGFENAPDLPGRSPMPTWATTLRRAKTPKPGTLVERLAANGRVPDRVPLVRMRTPLSDSVSNFRMAPTTDPAIVAAFARAERRGR